MQAAILRLLCFILIGACMPSGFGAESLKSSDTGRISLEQYLKTLHAAGIVVIIDCFEINKIEEKLDSAALVQGKAFSTSFYQISFKDKTCYVYPKLGSNRSEFLAKKIPFISLGNSSLGSFIKTLGTKTGCRLWLYSPTLLTIPENLEFKNKSVEEILLALAVACGSNRVVLSPIFYEDRPISSMSTMVSLYSP
jgi:hypothetical protein